MALQEGRCVNCGSILFLDPNMPEGHCFFCDCVFKNEDAFRASTNPEEFTFPNEPQPKYEGPSLTPVQMQHGPMPVFEKKSGAKKEVADEYVLPEKKVPSLKIPVKTIFLMIGITAALIGIFAAIAFPTINKRGKQQKEIADLFAAELPVEINKENDLVIQNMGSTSASVVLSKDLTLEESVGLFHKYCVVRAKALGIEDMTFAKTRKPVTLRIATPDGGYLIKQPADEAALLTTAITKLK